MYKNPVGEQRINSTAFLSILLFSFLSTKKEPIFWLDYISSYSNSLYSFFKEELHKEKVQIYFATFFPMTSLMQQLYVPSCM